MIFALILQFEPYTHANCYLVTRVLELILRETATRLHRFIYVDDVIPTYKKQQKNINKYSS